MVTLNLGNFGNGGGGGGGTVTGGASEGSGSPVFDSAASTATTLYFRSIAAGSGISIGSTSGTITITSTGGGTGVNTITGDSGGAIMPLLGNLNIKGLGDLYNVVGVSNTLTITPTAGAYPITPYVVGPEGLAGYQTVQSAINAANTNGGGSVYVQPGIYTENLTLYSDVDLIGTSGYNYLPLTYIVGVHTPPATSGSVTFRNIGFETTTHIISSDSSGTATLSCVECLFYGVQGYIYNLPNWTGTLLFDDSFSNGLTNNDGVINNTAGAAIAIGNSTLGVSSGNSMVVSGEISISNTEIVCPISFHTGSIVGITTGTFGNTLTFSNNATGLIDNSSLNPVIQSVDTASLIMSSSSTVTLSNCTVYSSATHAIDGSGSGTLALANVVFIDSTGINSALTLSTNGGVYPAGNLGSSGYVWTSNGAGAVPTFQAAGASGVSSVTGTANQVSATPTTGAVVVGLATSIITPGTLVATGLLTASASATINTAGTALNLATDNNTAAVNMATVGARTVSIGNTTGATALILHVGTGNFTLDGSANADYAIAASAVSGTIVVGGANQVGGIYIGNPSLSVSQNINIGFSSSAANVSVGGGSGTTNLYGNGNVIVNAGLTTASSLINASGLLLNTATSGFTYLSTVSGTPTGTPVSYTGAIPFVVDSANDLLYSYYAGAWQSISLSGGGGGVSSVTGTANQISASPTTGSVILTLPSAIITPGTLVTTGLLTASASATIGTFGTALNLATDSNTDAVNLATVGARTVSIGNTTGATSISERVGTGNFSLDGVGGSTYAIGASTTSGTITIGGSAQTGNIVLGSSSGTNLVAISTGSGTNTVNIAANPLGTNNTVSIATGFGPNVIAIGNSTSSGSITLKVGTGNFSLSGVGGSTYAIGTFTTSGTITIGGGAQTGTITLGTSAAAQTININCNATTVGGIVNIGSSSSIGTTTNIGTSSEANIVNIGSTTGAATTNIKAGSGNVNVVGNTIVTGYLSTSSSLINASGVLANTATTGFTYFSTVSGTPTGTPVSVTGGIPFVVDSANDLLYSYYSGAWQSLSLTGGGGGSGTVTGGASEGTGSPVFDSATSTASTLYFRSIAAGSGISVGSTSGTITITNTGGGGGGSLSTLTGDSGGAISPTSSNINIVGLGNLYNVVGASSTLTITPTAGAYPVTPYVVGAVGEAGYQTIQSAINAANSDGGGTVYIQDGTYAENLTLYTGVDLVGAAGNRYSLTTIISGVHTAPTGSGVLNIASIYFTTTSYVLSSASAGTCAINLKDCTFDGVTGFICNLPLWTGVISFLNCNDTSTCVDGIINNTGGSPIIISNSALGYSSTYTMISKGQLAINNSIIICPINAETGNSCQFNATLFFNTINLLNNSTYFIDNCSICPLQGGLSVAAVAVNTTGIGTISNCTIGSSNSPSITGTGTGALSFYGNTFLSNAALASTLTFATPIGGSYPAGNLGSSGYVWTSNGPGAVPTFQASSGGGTVTGGSSEGTGSAIFDSATSTSSNLAFRSLAVGTGLSLSSTSGTITLTSTVVGGVSSVSGTASEITVTPTTGACVVSLPSAIVTPGSLNVTTLLTCSASATINTNGTTLNIATDSNTDAVNLATVGARTVSIGNTTGATSISERVGTGNFSLDGVGGSTYAIGASTTSGTITIGGTAQTGLITVGSSSGSSTLDLGTGAGNSTINIGTGAGSNVITIGTTSGSTSITEYVGTGNFTLNGVGGSTYTFGAATTSGTVTIGGTAQTGTITLGSSSAANTVDIGTGAGATTVNMATGAGNNVVNIGTTSGSASMNLYVGTGGFALNGVGGSVYSIGAATTSGTITIGGTAQIGLLTVGNSSGTNSVNIGTGSGTTTIGIGLSVNSGAVNIGTNTINIGTSSSTYTITLGSGTGTCTVNMATASSVSKLCNICTGGGTGTIAVSIGSTGGTNTLIGTTDIVGNLSLVNAGNKMFVHATTSASDSAGTATLGAGGTVTVSSTATTTSSLVYLTVNTPAGTGSPGVLSLGTVTTGHFVVNSSVSTDTSTFNYWVVN